MYLVWNKEWNSNEYAKVKNNIIKGLFRQYGVFKINLPVTEDSTDDLHIDSFTIGFNLKGKSEFFNEEGGLIRFDIDPIPPRYSNTSVTSKIIIPIVGGIHELEKGMEPWIKKRLQNSCFLFYDENERTLKEYWLYMNQGESYREYNNAELMIGFDYGLECLGVYEWHKQ